MEFARKARMDIICGEIDSVTIDQNDDSDGLQPLCAVGAGSGGMNIGAGLEIVPAHRELRRIAAPKIRESTNQLDSPEVCVCGQATDAEDVVDLRPGCVLNGS